MRLHLKNILLWKPEVLEKEGTGANKRRVNLIVRFVGGARATKNHGDHIPKTHIWKGSQGFERKCVVQFVNQFHLDNLQLLIPNHNRILTSASFKGVAMVLERWL